MIFKNYEIFFIAFAISICIFLLTNFIPYDAYTVPNIGEYYSVGFPFAHTQMLGDAPLYKKEFLIVNFVIINTAITFIYKIIRFFK